jgi:ABC-type lipoprotein export system ATPase subunit
MEPLLELADVHFAYEEGISALAGVSLVVRPGERLAVLDANGCGKSTLLKLLGGLVFPLAGSYRAFGREITEPILSRSPFGMFFRKAIGILFQSLLLAANLVHIHRHPHEDYWHVHEHEHPEAFHAHGHPDPPGGPVGGADR